MRPPRTPSALCHVLRGTALLLALAPTACGKVQIASDAACVPVGADLPDDTFADADCDGVDGEASDAVFLDPVNGSDTGDGTRANPKAHLLGATGALMAAVATGKHHVLVSTGTLAESATVVVPDGISVWGGYDAAQAWTRSDAIARPLVQGADPTAVRFENTTTGMTWDRVDVRAADATAAGASSYGIVMISATSVLLISNAAVTAGIGAAGASSVTPPTPVTALTANGGVGSGLVSATCCVATLSDNCVAGTSGQNACAFGGGVGARCGQSGGAPTAGSGPGGGAPGNLREQGRPGAPGPSGSNAVAPAEAFGVTAANGYTPPQGTTGTSGSPGAGGGGGGLDYGGSCQCNTNVVFPPGHGGGAGGCGGGAATVAGGGGGSFGLFLVDSSPKLERVALESRAGGAGGAGATGGLGGAGGLGGGQPTATVAGGNGGSGGTGGTSSGGPGGPSICLAKVGTSSPELVTTPGCTLGAAGAGGISPDLALNGPSGLAAAEHPQP